MSKRKEGSQDCRQAYCPKVFREGTTMKEIKQYSDTDNNYDRTN